MDFTQSSPHGASSRKARRTNEPQRQLLTISDVAKTFGVTLRALRFYEDKGLLTPHRDGSARLYDERERERLSLILNGKKLGFTLGEIREMIATRSGGGSQATLALGADQITSQIQHLKRQRDDIDEAIAELNAKLAKPPPPSPTGGRRASKPSSKDAKASR